ncbi:TetR/AcrR family transcriptional regulator [Kitasatospora saccharophila]|uniref:TetR/AcrR family transcriptional regulator n=1 Tax=Kitasatospora saccharophila TaxID=407973 RepID=A0ABN2XI42_9ACTN
MSNGTQRALEDPLSATDVTGNRKPARTGGRAGKRLAIVEGARAVFGREGYSRTSIEAIAAEACVSTRTIYNHFESKEHLFSEVVRISAGQVAEAFVETAERQVGGVDPRADLIALGEAFVSHRTRFPEHFAMIRQIKAEAQHFPAAVIDAWQQAGPSRVQRELGRRLRALAEAGALRLDDPARAARHFIALVSAEITIRPYNAPAPSAAEVLESVTSGVDAFLHGYARRTDG